MHGHGLVLAVLLFTLSISCAHPHPHPTAHTHATHRRRTVGRRGLEVEVESYHPISVFHTSRTRSLHGKRHRTAFATHEHGNGSFTDAVVAYVQAESGVGVGVRYRTSYTSGDGDGDGDRHHVYLQQEHEGVPFANAVANIVIKNGGGGGDGEISAFGSSFVRVEPTSIAPSTPSYPLHLAIANAEALLDGKYNGHPTSLEYLVRPDGGVCLTYVVQVQTDEEEGEGEWEWYQAFVDAHSGNVVSVHSFVKRASYKVIPIQKQATGRGIGDAFEMVVDPEDVEASPLGWHDDGSTSNGGKKYVTTKGNNVLAGTWLNDESAIRETRQSRDGLVFDYEYDNETQEVDAARTQAFYVANKFHDVMYRYGFTEGAANFQRVNFEGEGGKGKGKEKGKGKGKGGDPVVIVVRDPSRRNNAHFATPPEYGPDRDGVFDNSVVIHELAHGVSGRLTGGGTGTCLETLEASGLSEGWSDAIAEWVQQTDAEVKDHIMFPYVSGDEKRGAREHPYSVDSKVNPLRANMLHIIFATLVKEHGFSSTAHTDPTGTAGNVVFLHIIMDGMALQPCNPTFIAARDAIIQADEDRYGGKHECLLWRAFASRGLGLGAVSYRDDGTVPEGC
ncbi:hypothetical protein V5O48_010245 [Marasmius crinis-equi]|uniref:Extracellular metalloproteinase n=1 Tax=Marasmius crinis-equi TaxID=585013 RepID=A0ABR3F8W7_9AGAR